ncbi:SDR family oxidoreductase [Streptomyces sp. MST-110588]|uniref:SDR family oxidoreductase n=1 Tax=Streptomyces sp. MST-110588 TaxID=2833628 RepID=UPI001F5D9EE5|nr:SDR family oxidoreductase [Streptomyces sp. MST-110588]UNO38468.1 SDR family oxidoreductase [Streptomyces sp. MST-110588]
MTQERPVVVTGCSSGIGRAVVRHLLGREHTVYATARDIGSIGDLASDGARILPVDLTDAGAMRECVRHVEARHGAVWGLVNNAGYALTGPVEELDMDQVRQQFEVNVFGHITMTQLVLPGMRRRGEGRIVNISSVASRFTLPGGGCYHASKHALASFGDALRYEVSPFGVRVSAIEPAVVRTRFIVTAVRLLTARGPGTGAYASFRDALADCYARVQRTPYRYGAVSADKVARAVGRVLASDSPGPRHVVGAAARLTVGLRWLLPGPLFDAVVRARFPVPRQEGRS